MGLFVIVLDSVGRAAYTVHLLVHRGIRRHWWWGLVRSYWWHSLFVLVAFIVRTGGIHRSYWWRLSFMLVHWCWWRLSFILVALVLVAFVICGVGAGSAHVGAVRAGVVPMGFSCYSSPIVQHWLVINLYVLSTHLSHTWLGIAARYQHLAVITSFIKPRKKDKSAVLNSKQSDHCPT